MRLQILAALFLVFGALSAFADPQRPADAAEVMDLCLRLQDGLQAKHSSYELDMNSCIDSEMIVSLKLSADLQEDLTIIGKLRFSVKGVYPRTGQVYHRIAHIVCSAPMSMDGQVDGTQINCDYRKKLPAKQF